MRLAPRKYLNSQVRKLMTGRWCIKRAASDLLLTLLPRLLAEDWPGDGIVRSAHSRSRPPLSCAAASASACSRVSIKSQQST